MIKQLKTFPLILTILVIWYCPQSLSRHENVYAAIWLAKKIPSVRIEPLEKPYKKHVDIIQNYLKSLETGDLEGMLALFNCGATVASTSSGIFKAKTFYTDFLPTIKSGCAKLQNVYINIDNPNRYSASFRLSLDFKDGSRLNANYIDEFEFNKSNDKLESVYMFENTKI